jgi:hypothetical protein
VSQEIQSPCSDTVLRVRKIVDHRRSRGCLLHTKIDAIEKILDEDTIVFNSPAVQILRF